MAPGQGGGGPLCDLKSPPGGFKYIIGTPPGAVTFAVSAVIDAITAALSQEEKVQLVGFGSFEVKTRAERVGRNPKTKETIQIPASKTPVFKAGKALKDAVSQ